MHVHCLALSCDISRLYLRQNREIEEPKVIYEASSDEDSDGQVMPPIHLLTAAASDSERFVVPFE